MKHLHLTQLFASTILLVALSTSSLYAATRSVEQARQAAQQQMEKLNKNKARMQGGATTTKSPQLIFSKIKQESEEDVYYYVFSAGSNLGYTIVSGDDRFPAIVGYTETGDYNTNDLPTNFTAFMQAYQDFVDNATDMQIEEIQEWRTRIAKHERVLPFMKEKWHQHSPYNNLCPEYEPGKKSITGCTATAIAQILHYYKYPNSLQADIPAYTTESYEINMGAIPSGSVYDWDNMLNVYAGNETEEQKNAVAKLLLDVGCAVEMDYGPSSNSGAKAETFTKYFGMDNELVQYLSRSEYTIDRWEEILYNEIKDKRPVYYRGKSASGGHIFVIHGYDDGLYYVNWGWGGSSDGYFDITILNSSNFTRYGDGNIMIIGIQPDNGIIDDVAASVPLFVCQELKASAPPTIDKYGVINASVYIKIFNANADEHHSNVNVGIQDTDGNIEVLGKNWEVTSLPGWYWWKDGFSISFKGVKDETYDLYVIESTDNKHWTICKGQEIPYMSIKVEGEEATFVPGFTLSAEISLADANKKSIDINISNTGKKEYYNTISIRASDSEDMPDEDEFTFGITAPAGGSTTFNIIYTPKLEKDYNFWVLDVDGNVIGQNRITFNTTAIKNITNEEGVGSYYDLSGTKATTPKKGIYIKDGKKYVFK